MARALILILVTLATVYPATAQQSAEREPLEITESGSDYLDAIRLRGIKSDVVYFNPDAPAPDFQTKEKPKPERKPDTSDVAWIENIPTALKVFAIAVTCLIVFLLFRFGGGISIAVRSAADNPERAKRRKTETAGKAIQIPGDLHSILAITDRREALITLAQAALARAIAAHGLLWHKSWTARDALRQLPRDQAHRKALVDLVAFGERVHFGGRDVSDDDFDTQLTNIRPLFQDGTA